MPRERFGRRSWTSARSCQDVMSEMAYTHDTSPTRRQESKWFSHLTPRRTSPRPSSWSTRPAAATATTRWRPSTTSPSSTRGGATRSGTTGTPPSSPRCATPGTRSPPSGRSTGTPRRPAQRDARARGSGPDLVRHGDIDWHVHGTAPDAPLGHRHARRDGHGDDRRGAQRRVRPAAALRGRGLRRGAGRPLPQPLAPVLRRQRLRQPRARRRLPGPRRRARRRSGTATSAVTASPARRGRREQLGRR